jgi:predicted Zn-dependent peptidase
MRENDIMNKENIRITRTLRGPTIISEHMPWVRGVSFSIVSRLGALDEMGLGIPAGTAHAMEHMIFRSSCNYTGEESSRLLEGLGADANAMTSSDYISYELTLPSEALSRALPILLDMVYCPRFLDEEWNIERSVILQEIGECKDNPGLVIQDAWYAHAYSGHPLSFPILGTSESLHRISRQDFLTYHGNSLHPLNTFVSIAGLFEQSEVEDILFRYSRFPMGKSHLPCSALAAFNPGRVVVKSDFEQCHVMIGWPAPPPLSPRRPAAVLASVALGSGMSSLLNVEVRERKGLAYSVSTSLSNEAHMSDFIMWAAADSARTCEAVRAMLDTLEKAATGLTQDDLNLSRNKMRAALLLEADGTTTRRQRNSREFLIRGEVRPLELVLDKLNSVELGDVRAILSEWANTPCLMAATGRGAECIERV